MALPDFSKSKGPGGVSRVYLSKFGAPFNYELELLEMRKFSKRNSSDESLGWAMRVISTNNSALQVGTRVDDSIPLYGSGADAALRVVPAFFLACFGQDPQDKANWTEEFLKSVNGTIVEATSEANPMKGCKIRARSVKVTLDPKFSKIPEGSDGTAIRLNYEPYTFGVPGLAGA